MPNFSKAFITNTIVACSVLAASNAFAQTGKQAPFTGFGLGVSVSSVKNSLDLSSTLYTSAPDFAKTSVEPALLGSYGFAISKDWVGTVGLSVGLKDSDYDSVTTGSTTSTAVAKNHIALSFAPGWRVNEQGLLYGKVALHSMRVNYTSNAGTDTTLTHQGTGIGFGYGLAISQNIEFRAEYESVQFDGQNTAATTTSKPKQTNFNFGLLYKF
jgi:opacity protein-like surface antigen